MLPKQLNRLRLALSVKAHRSVDDELLLAELQSLADRGGSVANESYGRKNERQETSAWGGDPTKCPVCGS